MTQQLAEDWTIWVSGYGSFSFEGTEQEAEKMRVHKGRWENGNSMKYRTDLSTELDKVTSEIVKKWSFGHGVSRELLMKRVKLKKEGEANV